jgi:hypothetical protein
MKTEMDKIYWSNRSDRAMSIDRRLPISVALEKAQNLAL